MGQVAVRGSPHRKCCLQSGKDGGYTGKCQCHSICDLFWSGSEEEGLAQNSDSTDGGGNLLIKLKTTTTTTTTFLPAQNSMKKIWGRGIKQGKKQVQFYTFIFGYLGWGIMVQ